MDENLIQYLAKTLPQKPDWVEDIEDQAKIDNVPIMDEISIEFLMQLIRLYQPKRILEIGTAIGYSALRILEAYPKAKIVTIEKDEQRVKQAIKNISKSQKSENIHVIHGDALIELNYLTAENEQFDLIFIDAAKGQYKKFFELSCPLLKTKGIVITDNVLFKGLVANPDEEKKRLNKIAHKIHHYNEWLVKRQDFTTSIVPIGDGVAISIKN